MNPNELRKRLYSVDVNGLRLDRDDVLLLLGFIPSGKWEGFFASLESYRDLRLKFLERPEDRDRFVGFATCLLELIYGCGKEAGETPRRATAEAFTGALTAFLDGLPPNVARAARAVNPEAFRDDVVYALYVDRFAKNFEGLEKQVDYLQDLGVNVIWLLPFLDSPQADAGYDQSNRYLVDASLGDTAQFKSFCEAVRSRNMTLMMDLVINHRSSDVMGPDLLIADPVKNSRRGRDYFLCVPSDLKTKPNFYGSVSAFEGMMAPPDPSGKLAAAGTEIKGCWSWHTDGFWYYHSFLPQQPDVDYDNPEVLIDDLRVLTYWIESAPVKYIRLDAIPFLFKRSKMAKATVCPESAKDMIVTLDPEVRAAIPEVVDAFDSYADAEFPQMHLMVRLISAFLKHRYGDSVGLLTESNSSVERWKKYFGEGTGTKLNYQFYRMQAFWASLFRGDRIPLARALSVSTVHQRNCAGVMFGRVHDELTFERAEAEVTRRALDQLKSRMTSVPNHLSDAERASFERINARLQDENRRRLGRETRDRLNRVLRDLDDLEPDAQVLQAKEALDALLDSNQSHAKQGGNVERPINPYDFCNRGIAARMSSVLRALPANPDFHGDRALDLKQKHCLAMALLMSFDDVPLIYMGDERGEADNWSALEQIDSTSLDMRNLHRDFSFEDGTRVEPDSRKLTGTRFELYEITRRLIQDRRASDVMRRGTLQLIEHPGSDESTLMFYREYSGKRILVAVNFSLSERTAEAPSTIIPGGRQNPTLFDLLTKTDVPITVDGSYATFSIGARDVKWLVLS